MESHKLCILYCCHNNLDIKMLLCWNNSALLVIKKQTNKLSTQKTWNRPAVNDHRLREGGRFTSDLKEPEEDLAVRSGPPGPSPRSDAPRLTPRRTNRVTPRRAPPVLVVSQQRSHRESTRRLTQTKFSSSRHHRRRRRRSRVPRILTGPGLQTLSHGSYSRPLKVKYKAVGEGGLPAKLPAVISGTWPEDGPRAPLLSL